MSSGLRKWESVDPYTGQVTGVYTNQRPHEAANKAASRLSDIYIIPSEVDPIQEARRMRHPNIIIREKHTGREFPYVGLKRYYKPEELPPGMGLAYRSYRPFVRAFDERMVETSPADLHK